MFDRIKERIYEANMEAARRKLEMAEFAEEVARCKREEEEAERIRIMREQEEIDRINAERIMAEKNALMAMNEKELIVELIFTMRKNQEILTGFQDKLEHIESRIGSLDSEMWSVRSGIDELRYR